MIERPAVFDVERRQMGGGDPQRMDFRSIVRRRLFALGYSLSDGAIVDDAGTVIVDAGDTSNSGQTPAELVAAGYSAADVAQLAGSIAPNVSGASGAASLSKPAPGGAGAAVEPVPIIVDAGTGSGCLAVCLAREFPWSRVIATDLSAPALEVAARNAHRHGVAGRIEFVRTSLLDGVACPATLIVSNPPYVPAGDLPALPPEVREWEPTEALDGGADGLDLVRALLESAPLVLAPGGWLIMEFGYGQEDDVRALLRRSPLHLVGIRKDLQQIPRTLVARS